MATDVLSDLSININALSYKIDYSVIEAEVTARVLQNIWRMNDCKDVLRHFQKNDVVV